MDNILFFGGLGTGAFASLCFLLYRNRETLVRRIEEAPVLKLGPELVTKLQSTEDRKILYAVISGTALPVKDVIKSTNESNIDALVQTLKLKEHKTEWSKTSKIWSDSVRTLSSATKEVPFKLLQEDEYGNTGVAYVEEPLLAEGLKLEVIYDRFEPVNASVAESLVQWASGEKTKGFQKIEEVLTSGTTLTSIGEVVLENDQVKIRPPQNPFRYILSNLPLNGIIREQKSATRLWKAVAVVFGLGGSIMLLVWLYRAWQKYRDRVVTREILNNINNEEDNGGLVEGTQCVVCFDNPRNVVLLDCGHICVCRDCAGRLQDCPVCRRHVVRVINTYNS